MRAEIFGKTVDVGTEPGGWSRALEPLVAHNMALLGAGLPGLYEAPGSVVYRAEPKGQERWLGAEQVRRRGKGDCEDLAAYRVAELRRRGFRAVVGVTQTSPVMYHAIVATPEGRTIEDPTAILKMREKMARGLAGGEARPDSPRWAIFEADEPGKFIGAVGLPASFRTRDGQHIGPGFVQVMGAAADPLAAMQNAAGQAAYLTQGAGFVPVLPAGWGPAQTAMPGLTAQASPLAFLTMQQQKAPLPGMASMAPGASGMVATLAPAMTALGPYGVAAGILANPQVQAMAKEAAKKASRKISKWFR